MDGLPRTVFQAAALDDVLLIEERELSCVLELKVDERTLLDRILARAVQAKGQRRAGETR
ncbi:nucleoside monophosphate kinase [Bradyrhizobium murdochi]|uniref:nucleoside monophosphate kinase n=1 Tax=Bradyrhizobium murdochi TaxID=1038859 RepID=UPI003D31FC5F